MIIFNSEKMNNSTFEIKTTGMYQQNRTIKVHIIEKQEKLQHLKKKKR